MSKVGAYPLVDFKESQQFLARDPSRSQLVRVTGDSILDGALESLLESGAVVQSIDTLTEAIATNYESGAYVLTGGELVTLDGGQAIYRVSDSGSGGIVMDNGNELVLLFQANSGDAGNYNVGSDDGEIPTNEIADSLRIKSVSSISALPPVVIGNKISVTGYHPNTTVGGGDFVGIPSGRHDGVIYFDPDRSSGIGTAAYYVDSGIDTNCFVRTISDNLTISQAGDNVTAATVAGKSLGLRVSLEGREVVTTDVITDDMYDWLFDGFVVRFNIAYPMNVWDFQKSVIATQDQGPNLNYNAWPQGKVYKSPHEPANGQSKLKILFNRGSSHQSNDLTVWSMESQDGFNTLSEPVMESGRVDFSQGNTAWSAGTDGTRQYFITRERGANYNIGTSRHFLNYATEVETLGGYVRKLINFDDGTEVPVLFHSFAKLGNGKLAVGYQFTSGEVGLAFTDSDSTVGDAWTKSIMFAAGSTYVEPSILYDTENSATVGFLRTQNSGNPPQFYVSTDNGATFSFSDVTDLATGVFLESPINIAKSNGNYYALVTERTKSCRMYLLIADAADAVANGFSAFKKYFIGNSNYAGATSSGAGAGDLYADDEKVVLFYGEHSNTSEAVNIVKMVIDFDKIKNSSARYLDSRTNAIVSKEFKYDLTANLESEWSAEDSGEGAEVNGGGLFAYKRGSKLRITGYLKTTDATAPIITLPQHLHPWASHKQYASYNDTIFTMILYRGVPTIGTSGELKLLNATGAQSKVMIDFEVDLLR